MQKINRTPISAARQISRTPYNALTSPYSPLCHAPHAIAGIAHALHATATPTPAYRGYSRNCESRGVYKRVGLYKNLTPSGAWRYTCGGLLRRLLRLLFSLLLIRCQGAICSDVPYLLTVRGFACPADLLLTSRRVASPPAAVLLSCVGDRRRREQDRPAAWAVRRGSRIGAWV